MSTLIIIFALLILASWLLVDNDIAQDEDDDFWNELERGNKHD